MNTLKSLICALCATSLLVACGGGGGDSSEVADGTGGAATVPSTAMANSEAFTSFVSGLAPDESAEPMAMEALDLPPTSETAEPVGLS